MRPKEIIEELALQYPICEYCFGETKQLNFSDKVWYICETDCKRYGHSWACPPHCGSIEENIKKCLSYQNFFLFSTVVDVENAWDAEVCLKAKAGHEEITRELDAQLKKRVSSYYILSTGCTTCEVCACPDEPCRHPEQRLCSMESHGLVVMQTAEEMQMCYNYGGDTIVYFSIVLFN